MALASISNGTQTATPGTEHTLVTDTTGKTYVLLVDTANLVNDETVTLRIKTKVLSAGVEGLAYVATYKHAQNEAIKISPPVPALHSFKATLEQNGGTGRAFDWEVLSLD